MARHGRPEPLLLCSRLFTIVHDCSPLFGIVQLKILRLSQCPLSVLTGNRPVRFSRNTRHETQFPRSYSDSKESNPKPDQQVFTNHETRDTNHGFYSSTRHDTRNVSPFGSPWERKRHITKNLRRATVSLRPFAWPCAAWRGYGAAWAAVVPRTGNTAC